VISQLQAQLQPAVEAGMPSGASLRVSVQADEPAGAASGTNSSG
jgi:hypothetical protein